ncbi:helix-turn-helix domain-containing protein [Microbacterium sp. G2-8]|uniref:winged helix-turn-helix transcriptional regulator n=1 Tax=Microbacterium sp. G2-8 TaxID=2842454 RepID=UPI001C899841|nr:helix-turn-helix domain-containing protein [Microbacterium sp. G2-8]
MATSEHDLPKCDAAVSLAFSVLGKRWNGMIIDALREETLSFSRLRRTVTGISDAVLSDRLVELANVGLVAREVQSGPPVSVAYSLTPGGSALVPVLDELGAWASEHIPVAHD